MFQLKYDNTHRKYVNNAGMFSKVTYLCTNCFTPIVFFDVCDITCPGCLKILPPINELLNSSNYKRVAYHQEKLL